MNFTLPPEVLSAIDEAGYEVAEVRQCTKADMVFNSRTMKCHFGQPLKPFDISSGLYPILRKKPSEIEILRARLKEVEAERDEFAATIASQHKTIDALHDEEKLHRAHDKELTAEVDRLQAASLKLSPEVQAELDRAGCEATGEYRATLRSDYGWLSPAGVVRLMCGVGTFAAEYCPRLILRKRSVPKSIACMEQDEHRNDLPVEHFL